MSLFYLLAVIALWGGLTYWFWRLWRSVWEKSGTKWRCIITPVFALVAIVWLSASFWYGGGRKFYYDAEVRRLCAIDGGVKVYETVEWPPEKFDKWGNVNIPSKQNAKSSDDYFYENITTYIRQNNPSLWRSYTTMLRKSDRKILGEAVSYHRVGGDLPGPWHPSSLGCPKPSELNLEQAVFTKGDTK